MNYLLTIIGPTAIGKTALGIKLAQHFNCEIISCDSRQFFKEMSIGTAAPSVAELSAAPHHFIHNKSIFDPYSVGDFEKEATTKLDMLYQTNDFAVMVGGSGLYVDAVLKGFDDFPEIENAVREKVQHHYKESGILWLQEELKTRDPLYFENILKENPQTLQNPQRLMRFVEVCLGTGKPYSSFLDRKKNERNFIPVIIGLEAERQVMYERINLRVDLMMEAGLLAEAEKLYPDKNLNALQTVGYREIFDYFDGNISLDFAIEEIKKNTRRFSKRQLTWFKRTENAKWFDYRCETSEIIDYIREKTQ